jgi:hypothetical protein
VIVVVIVVRIFSLELKFGRRQCRAFGALDRRLFLGRQCGRLALRGFALAHFPVILPGIENQMQPRHHLFDRRQLAGRTGFAARTGCALHAGLALQADLTGFALWADFTALALRTRLAFRASLATRTFRSRLAWRSGLARRSGLAPRTFKSGSSGMALRSGTAGFAARALRSLSSLPGRCLVGHVLTPKMILRGVL